MKLPSKSNWHLTKGTWFVYQTKDLSVHIQLKNNGMQNVYVNEELVESKRSLRLKTEISIENSGHSYLIRTYPNNKTFTSFSTDLVIDNELMKIYTFHYKRDLKSYLPFIGVIVLLTIILTLLKLPVWTLYVMVLVSVTVKILLFKKSMFLLDERDPDVKIEI